MDYLKKMNYFGTYKNSSSRWRRRSWYSSKQTPERLIYGSLEVELDFSLCETNQMMGKAKFINSSITRVNEL